MNESSILWSRQTCHTLLNSLCSRTLPLPPYRAFSWPLFSHSFSQFSFPFFPLYLLLSALSFLSRPLFYSFSGFLFFISSFTPFLPHSSFSRLGFFLPLPFPHFISPSLPSPLHPLFLPSFVPSSPLHLVSPIFQTSLPSLFRSPPATLGDLCPCPFKVGM